MIRLIVAAAFGVVVGVGVTWSSGAAAILAAWATTAVLFVAWTWGTIFAMSPEETRGHATREEPTRLGAHLIVIVAALVSLVGVVEIVLGPDHGRARATIAMLAAVVASWAAIHTVFALRYARMYFTGTEGGIDFHTDEPPRYSDFAYVAVTVGMSFAISDTDLSSFSMRRTALVHGLLSYLFGTVIIALLVNLVASS